MSTVTAPANAPVKTTAVLPGKPLSNELRASYARLTAIRAEEKALAEEKKALTSELLDAMGGHTVALLGGIKVFSIITSTRTNVDSRLLAEAFPEAYQAVTSQSSYKSIR